MPLVTQAGYLRAFNVDKSTGGYAGRYTQNRREKPVNWTCRLNVTQTDSCDMPRSSG